MLSFGRSEFPAHFSFAWMTYLPISGLAAPPMTHFLFLLTWKCSYFSSFLREGVLLDVEFFSESFAPIICQTSRTLPDGLSTERFSFWERTFILIGVFSPPGLGVCCFLLAWRSSVRRSVCLSLSSASLTQSAHDDDIPQVWSVLQQTFFSSPCF